MKIKKLSKVIINQIAAGEVITRPACVVRELMQNAIDAEATQITVEVWHDDETILKIRIRDNGSGIDKDQMELAFLKHTTSKIAQFEDIFSIKTLGFRGEALSSIASISEVTAISSTNKSGAGIKLVLRGSDKIKSEAVPAQQGFMITVSDLFFNTPVRTKFLKKLTGEKIAIKEEVVKHILATDGIDINYIVYNNDHEISRLNAPAIYGLQDKIFSLFKRQDLAGNLIKVSATAQGYHFNGYLTNQRCRMANRKTQFFFIGKRVVESPIFYKTLDRAYAHILPSRRYPMAFIRLSFEGQRVDVNVHPTKKEIRFQNTSDFSTAFYSVVHQIVFKNILSKQKSELHLPDANVEELSATSRKSKFSKPGQVFSEQPSAENTPPFQWAHLENESTTASNHPADLKANDKEHIANNTTSTPAATSNHAVSAAAPMSAAVSSIENSQASSGDVLRTPAKVRPANLRVVAQVAKCYIVFILNEELYIVDQHAAHERINYNKIMTELDKKKLDRVALIVPLFYERSVTDTDKIIAHKQTLDKLGVSVDLFSKTVVSVSEVPQFIPEHKLEILISELLDVVIEHVALERSDFYRETIARMACRMSVMAGDSLTLVEMENLILSLYERGALLTCPHGRPFVKKIDAGELAKFFDRTRHLT
ncbi:DNA mismatch repair protein MutL [Spirochaetota bacterium]|nr:DNA mismatch repair protein MutL [Spirochaetota bacterium]